MIVVTNKIIYFNILLQFGIDINHAQLIDQIFKCCPFKIISYYLNCLLNGRNKWQAKNSIIHFLFDEIMIDFNMLCSIMLKRIMSYAYNNLAVTTQLQ